MGWPLALTRSLKGITFPRPFAIRVMYFRVSWISGRSTGCACRIAGEMSRRSAFHFLCDCLSCIPAARLPVFSATRDFRWATFIALTHEYRVSPMVASALELLPPSSSSPSAVRLFFSSLATHHRLQNERVRDEAIEVADILNSTGVRPLYLKGGAHLLTDLYPDIAMRQVSDLDILVPAARVDDCVAALRGRGITEGLQVSNVRF